MTTIILFLVVLSVLVFVHEFGHYFSAKRLGVKVEEFGFGFPPRAFGVKRGGTTYSVNWIPLGGFVRIKGESGEDGRDPDSFVRQSAPRRLLILAAGVLMNLLLAWGLFTIGAAIGLPEALEGQPSAARIRERSITVTDVLPGSPAESAGLSYGDRIAAIDGAAVVSFVDLTERIAVSAGREVTLEVRRGSDGTRNVAVTPVVLEQTGKPGIGVGLVESGIVSYPWYLAPLRGLELTWRNTIAVFAALGSLVVSIFSGNGVTADVAGPVGIAVATGQVARLGFTYLLQFTALLSINLAVINLLPLPALDGGRVLFLAIEKIRRKPVDRALEGIVHQIGFALLLLLALLVTFQDVRRFGGGIIDGIGGMFR